MNKTIIILVFFINALTYVQSFRRFQIGKIFEKTFLKVNESTKENYTVKWFTQTVDHSDPTNHQTWQQKYLVNDQYFDETERSVAFLFIGGESAASPFFMASGAWIEFAEQFNALAIQVEHRFYGQSQPSNASSFEYYKYFTSEQALNDLANIIQSLSPTFKHPPRWVVFGGSYAGSLAAWLKLKYPHLIKGAVSSSAPLLAKIDFFEYYQVVAQDLKGVSEECYNRVKTGNAQIESMFESSSGRNQLTSLFHLCDPLEDDEHDINMFIDTLNSNFAAIAQYNKDNRFFTSKEVNDFTLDSLCNIITNETDDKTEVEALAAFNEVILHFSAETCVDVNYTEMVGYYQNPLNQASSDIAWFFQTCNEFGWYQSPHQANIFGTKNMVNYYVQLCQDLFGSSFDKRTIEANIMRTNIIYGGLSNDVDDVIYVQGSVDPWHKLGLTHSDNPAAPALFINGTAHCADVYPSDVHDVHQLTDSRKQIRSKIESWVV